MYFVRNIEDEKLEIHFSKAEYQAMPEEKKNYIKRSCLFSGARSCWRSRGKLISCGMLIQWLVNNQFEDQGSIGEKLSFAEKVEREQEKAANRIEKYENRAEAAEAEASSLFDHARKLGDVIPMGQPILVGHHSESRHRNHIKKMDNAMRKGCEATDKAEYYNRKLEAAEHTAEGKKYKNAGYLVNRIKECKARINQCERGLQGKSYSYSQPSEITEKQREYWNEQMADAKDKLDFMMHCLNQIKQEKTVWDRESLAGKTKVMIKGRWRDLVKCNPTTVAVSNLSFHAPVFQKKYALKYNYGEIQGAE